MHRMTYTGRRSWDLARATYDNIKVDIVAEALDPRQLAIGKEGNKMYILDAASDKVLQYSMSEAGNVGTATYDSVSLSIGTQDTSAAGMVFSIDGTKLYMIGNISDKAYQYNLTTAWDLSTASYASKSVSVVSQDNVPRGIALSTDGTKMYITGTQTAKVFQYTLSTAWDISTATYDSIFINTNTEDVTPFDIAFRFDGERFFIPGNNTLNVYEYALTTAWDLSTASYTGIFLDISPEISIPTGLTFRKAGHRVKMYIIRKASQDVFQYTI